MTPKDVVILMPESCSFRTPFSSQRFNGSQALLKPTRQHFYPNFQLFSDKFTWKKSVLVISQILELSFNTLMTRFFIRFENNFCNKFKHNYLQNQNHFLQLPLCFWNLHKILRHLVIISEVIVIERCGYLNAWKHLFQSTHLQSTC